MTDNVVYLNRDASADRPASAAERHRQEAAGRLAKEAAEIRTWLESQSRVPHHLRQHFGRVVYRMFEELEASAGKSAVAEVLVDAEESERGSTELRGCFAQDRPLKTKLVADGKRWCKVVCAAGRRLRGEDRALVDPVAGSDYKPKSLPVLGEVGDDAAETAGHLNLLCTWVSVRYRLDDYYATLRASDYMVSDGQIVVPDIPPLAADPDSLADAWSIPIDVATIAALIPHVPILDRFVACTAAKGAIGDLLEAPIDAAIWEEVAAQQGVEECSVDLGIRVTLGVAPLEPGATPTACFVLTPVISIPLLGGVVDVFPTAPGWIPFKYQRDGEVRWSAVHIPEWPSDAGDFVALVGHVRTDAVTGASCMRWLGGAYRGQHRFHIEGADDDVGGEDLPPTAAPNRTILGVVQRNLAYAPEPQKISTLLSSAAQQLVEQLAQVRLRERGAFEEAMAASLQKWRDGIQED